MTALQRTRCLTLATLLLAFGTVEAQAQSWAEAGTRLTLRETPTASARALSSVPEGYPVLMLGCDGGWCVVSYMGVRGYTPANTLVAVDRPAPSAEELAAEGATRPPPEVADAVPAPPPSPTAPPVSVPAVSAASPPTPPTYLHKDAGTAILLSVLITGGGHLYAGESGTGLLLLGGAAASVIGGTVLAFAMADEECYRDSWGTTCEVWPSLTPFVMGGLAAVGFWLYGVADSGNAVHRHNQRVSRTAVSLSPVVGPQQAGLAMRVQF